MRIRVLFAPLIAGILVAGCLFPTAQAAIVTIAITGNVFSGIDQITADDNDCALGWNGCSLIAGCTDAVRLLSIVCPPPYSDPPFGNYVAPDSARSYPFFITLTTRDGPKRTQLPAGTFLAFRTTLVGVSTQGTIPCGTGSRLYCTPLYSWTWTSNYTGTTGGVTITSINGILQ